MKTNYITYDISNQDYHDDRTHISSSALKLLRTDPGEYINRYILNLSSGTSAALDVGTATHTLVLEPELAEDELRFADTGRKTKAYKEFSLQHPGKIILDPMDTRIAFKLAKAAHNSKLLKSLLSEGMAEPSIFATINDVQLKARLDYIVPGKYILDLKTCRYPLNEFTIRKVIDESDYDLSAALYMRTWNALVGPEDQIDTYYLAFISKATYQVLVVALNNREHARGNKKLDEAIKNLTELRSSGKLIIPDESKIIE